MTLPKPVEEGLKTTIQSVMSQLGINVRTINRDDGVVEITGSLPQKEPIPNSADITYKVISAQGFFEDSVVGPDPDYHGHPVLHKALILVDQALGKWGYEKVQRFSPLVQYKQQNTMS